MAPGLLRTAVEAAHVGGEILRSSFRGDHLEIEEKARHDLVTSADRASEAAIRALLRDRFPAHSILAEEGGRTGGGQASGETYEWIVDPLDGTTNFAQGLPNFSVSIACRRGRDRVVGVVYDPVGENLFLAERGSGATWNDRPMQVSSRPGLSEAFLATGFPFRARAALDLYLEVFHAVFLEARAIRRLGSAAIDLAYVAAGIFDGFFEFHLSPWDTAAGSLLIEEAGGAVFDLDGGERFLETGNVVAGPVGVARELQGLIATVASEDRLRALGLEPTGLAQARMLESIDGRDELKTTER